MLVESAFVGNLLVELLAYYYMECDISRYIVKGWDCLLEIFYNYQTVKAMNVCDMLQSNQIFLWT